MVIFSNTHEGIFQVSLGQFGCLLMAPRPISFSQLFLCSIALVAVVSGAGKSDGTKMAAFPDATMLFTKCLAPLKSVFSLTEFRESEPVCSAEEFSTFNGAELMNLKDISSLPPSYFESLRSEQASQLTSSFINQLGKEQALAFPREAIVALPANSRKLLNKIKRKPGPVARAVIMGFSAVTAFIIFKYS